MSEIRLENVAEALCGDIREFMCRVHDRHPELKKLSENSYAEIKSRLESPTGLLNTMLEEGKNGFEMITGVFDSIPVYQDLDREIAVVSTHDMAAEIADCLEDELDREGIFVPNDEREGDEGEACLYGSDYDELLTGIEGTLIDTLEPVREGYEYENESEVER